MEKAGLFGICLGLVYNRGVIKLPTSAGLVQLYIGYLSYPPDGYDSSQPSLQF